jgi:GWxTD domain-containing protein
MRNALFVLAGVLFLYGCPSTRKISNQNLSHLYRRSAAFLHPYFIIHHSSDSTSRLHFKVDSEELLYTRQGPEQDFTAAVRIVYILTSSYESKEILDSASTVITDINNENLNKEIVGSIDIKAAQGMSYILHVRMTDMKRNQAAEEFITIDKKDRVSGQNYIAISAGTGVPLFRNYVSADEEIKLQARADVKQLTVRYYKRSFPVAGPPYSVVSNKTFSYKADSIFTLTLDAEHSTSFKLPQLGFYHFQSDTASREGFTLFRFKEPFPQIGAAGQLVMPLLYITTEEEYEALLKHPDPKAAADDFWLKMTGSRERGKEVIRKFYNRVQDANTLFTSYTEGWKTDRGMIYIVYGPPSAVYRTDHNEVWIYGQDKMISQSNFTFERVSNPFTDNDYSLERSPVYKPGWHNTITVWRQGRVYIDN